MRRTIIGAFGRDAHGWKGRIAAAAPGLHQYDDGLLVAAWTVDALEQPPATGVVVVLDGTVFDVVGEPPAGGRPRERFRNAVRFEGLAALPRLRGDVTVLWWDPERQSGFLARDQMGGAGLFWTRRSGTLLFASEIVDLLAILASTPPPDAVALARWLSLGAPPRDGTLYDGVARLEAGCLIALDSTGAGAPRRWWHPRPRGGADAGAQHEDHVAAVRAGIERAVRRRCDAGAGAILLSGGLDSGTVAAFASLAHPRRAYGAVFPAHPSVDERALIDEVVAALGIALTVARVEQAGSIAAGALPYLARWATPPSSPNGFFWDPLMARVGADGATMLLDGEGGDELFGLSPFLIADRLRRGNLVGAVRLIRALPLARRPGPRRIARALRVFGVKGALPPALESALRRRRDVIGRSAPRWLAPGLVDALAEVDDEPSWKRLDGSRWRAHLIDVATRGAGVAQTFDQIRRRAAGAQVAVSHPLADPDLVELLLDTPPGLAFDARRTRPLLRDAGAGVVPDAVRLRTAKSTFDALAQEALLGADRRLMLDLLAQRDCAVAQYVDRAAAQADLELGPPPDPHGRALWAIRVWWLLGAELWLRSLADAQAPARAVGALRAGTVVLSP